MTKADIVQKRVELRDGTLYWRILNRPVLLRVGRGGYLRFNISHKGKTVTLTAHRAVWLLHYGDWPKNEIDHINRDPADNRIANLRDVTRQENMCNRLPVYPFRSGKGVYFDPRSKARPWRAYIQRNNHNYFLGTFETRDGALKARLSAEARVRLAANWRPGELPQSTRPDAFLPLAT